MASSFDKSACRHDQAWRPPRGGGKRESECHDSIDRYGAMTLIPRSIRGRLLLVGLLLTGIALVAATVSIDAVLDTHVRRSLNQSLDGQIALLARSVRADGTVDRTLLQEIGPYTQYRRGWAWRIETPRQVYTSTEKIGQIDFREEGPTGREGHFGAPPEILRTGSSGPFYVRILEEDRPAGRVRITATAPHLVYERLRSAAIMPVLVTLGGLSIALLLASLVQSHIGLRPMARLRKALGEVRAGRVGRVPVDQPVELRPLVAELNDLLDENEAALARARGHVANLAHSLKTPLATLSVKLNDLGRDPDGELGELVAQIDGAIRHHLGRARAASPGAPGQIAVLLAPAVADLIDALGRIHADRGVRFENGIAPDLTVKCDPQDLTEMLGNLLDNAAKWAASTIVVTGEWNGGQVQVRIDDDGPGLGQAVIEQALVPGRRLDEREDGHGFGLPIARELAELHGGSLELGASPLGGLRVILSLPG